MVVSSLQTKGWCLNESLVESELESAEESDRLKDAKRLEEFLLDSDLKDVGTSVLYEKFDRKKGEVTCPLILQLMKWRNLNYPIVNNHDKNVGVCTMTLSDGHSSIRTFSIDPISKIDGNTPFGSKILLTGKVRSENGLILLTNKNTIFLGGHVEKLVEKWNAEKYAGNERKVTNAPKWVQFSKAKNLNVKFDKNFSALKNTNTGDDKEVDEKTAQFIASRQAKIEVLDVSVPKPVQELDTRFKAISLNNETSSITDNNSRNEIRQYSRGGQSRGRGHENSRGSQSRGNDSRPHRELNNEYSRGGQPRGNDSRPHRELNNEYSRGGQSRGNDSRPQHEFKNEYLRGGQSRGNDSRPQHEFKNEYSRGGQSRGNDSRPQREFKNEYSRGGQSRGNSSRPPRELNNEYSRGGQSRGNSSRPQSNYEDRPQRQFDNQARGDNRGTRGNRGSRGNRSSNNAGQRGNQFQDRQNSQYSQQSNNVRLDLSDFPQLGS